MLDDVGNAVSIMFNILTFSVLWRQRHRVLLFGCLP